MVKIAPLTRNHLPPRLEGAGRNFGLKQKSKTLSSIALWREDLTHCHFHDSSVMWLLQVVHLFRPGSKHIRWLALGHPCFYGECQVSPPRKWPAGCHFRWSRIHKSTSKKNKIWDFRVWDPPLQWLIFDLPGMVDLYVKCRYSIHYGFYGYDSPNPKQLHEKHHRSFSVKGGCIYSRCSE